MPTAPPRHAAPEGTSYETSRHMLGDVDDTTLEIQRQRKLHETVRVRAFRTWIRREAQVS